MRAINREERELLAYAVAADWLKFSERCLGENKVPARLSENGVRLVSNELERPMYDRIHATPRILRRAAQNAVYQAKAILRHKPSEYPRVLQHFQFPAQPQPVSA